MSYQLEVHNCPQMQSQNFIQGLKSNIFKHTHTINYHCLEIKLRNGKASIISVSFAPLIAPHPHFEA